MSPPLAVALDDPALRVFPRLEVELSSRGVRVLRSFAAVPGAALLGRLPGCRGAAVVGGRSWGELVGRLEQATAATRTPIIGVLPGLEGARPELRWPGVVDLIPPGEPRPAERVVLMSQVPVVSAPGRALTAARPDPPPGVRPASRVVAVASSTGGVWVLAQLLRALAAARCRDAVLVAQHLDAEFVPFFADWLHETSGWPVRRVEESAEPAPGEVHLAAGGCDLVLAGDRLRAVPASGRFVPSGDRLLASVARARGPAGIGVVLSGMGADGAAGLAELVRAGGRAFCQLPETAIVASMPQSALRAAPGARAAAPAFLAAALLEG